MWPLTSRTGTVSVKVPEPSRRHTSVIGVSGARNSTKSVMPPSCWKTSSIGPSSPGVPLRRRSSRMTRRRPGTRKEVCRARPRMRVVVELGVLEEDLPVGPEAHPRAGDAPLRLADDRQRALLLVGGELGVRRVHRRAVGEGAGLAAAEAHAVRLAGAVDLDVEPRGQRVDDGGPDPVEATRGGIRRAAELATGVQLREDHLDTGQAGAGLDVDGDAATVVPDLDGAVAAEDHLDAGADAGQRLVDRVVDDLPQAVHETALVGRADVHARALAHGLEALEDLEVARGVVAVAGGSRSGGGGHVCRSLSVGNGQRSGCGGLAVEA